MNKEKKNILLVLGIVLTFVILGLYLRLSLKWLDENGFLIIDYIVYSVGFIIILFFTVCFDLNNVKEKNENINNKKNNIQNKIRENLLLHFYKEQFYSEEEEKDAKEDCASFDAHDWAMECLSYYLDLDSFDSKYEYFLKMKYKNKEIIYFGNDIRENAYFKGQVEMYHISLGILKEIDNEKRLHIKTKSNISSNINSYEDVFEDFKQFIEEFDKKNNKNKYEDDLLRKYNGKELKDVVNDSYIELDNEQKQFLLNLYKQTKLPFSLVLEKGIMRIRINFKESYGIYEKIDDEELAKNISDIFIRIIKEFKM